MNKQLVIQDFWYKTFELVAFWLTLVRFAISLRRFACFGSPSLIFSYEGLILYSFLNSRPSLIFRPSNFWWFKFSVTIPQLQMSFFFLFLITYRRFNLMASNSSAIYQKNIDLETLLKNRVDSIWFYRTENLSPSN